MEIKLFNNNIYKLIKSAKDEKSISDNPLKRIIPNPIKFVYSFTLNTNNETYTEEIEKNQEISSINIESFIRNNTSLKKGKNKEIKKRNDSIKENEIKDNNEPKREKEIKDNNPKFEGEKPDKKEIYNQNNALNNKQSLKIKDIYFINKKRTSDNQEKKYDNKEKNKNTEIRSSNSVKNNIIHHIYNSKSINLWEDDDNEDNNTKKKEIKNDNIIPIHKQIEFIQKCPNAFKKHDIAVKSDYDKELDKGRVKKKHKNKIGFKKHKNFFQKISNKIIKYQKRNNEYN